MNINMRTAMHRREPVHTVASLSISLHLAFNFQLYSVRFELSKFDSIRWLNCFRHVRWTWIGKLKWNTLELWSMTHNGPNKVQDKTHCQSKHVHSIDIHDEPIPSLVDPSIYLWTKCICRQKSQIKWKLFQFTCCAHWNNSLVALARQSFMFFLSLFLRFPLIEFQTSRWLCAVEDVPDNVNNRLAGEKQKEQKTSIEIIVAHGIHSSAPKMLLWICSLWRPNIVIWSKQMAFGANGIGMLHVCVMCLPLVQMLLHKRTAFALNSFLSLSPGRFTLFFK